MVLCFGQQAEHTYKRWKKGGRENLVQWVKKRRKNLLVWDKLCTFAPQIKNHTQTMKLNDIFSGNYNAAEWEAKGYELPKFDIKAVREKTAKEPTWVHFGG